MCWVKTYTKTSKKYHFHGMVVNKAVHCIVCSWFYYVDILYTLHTSICVNCLLLYISIVCWETYVNVTLIKSLFFSFFKRNVVCIILTSNCFLYYIQFYHYCGITCNALHYSIPCYYLLSRRKKNHSKNSILYCFFSYIAWFYHRH